MRRTVPGGTWVFGALVTMSLLAQMQILAAPPRKKRAEPPLKVEETVGDLAYVVDSGQVRVEGVGLVTGLDNTGGDPPPSVYRTQLIDEMSKAGVEHPSRLLADPRFSMVIVRMTIPTGANPQDRLDVEVELPPASGTRSLAGGFLIMTRLREVMMAGGTFKGGPDVALAQGPVMIGNAKEPGNLKVGRVLGGGRVKKEFPYTLVIKDKRRSVRTAAILEKVVNERFHQSEAGQQKGSATAKTDSYLILKVPPIYHQDQDRYFRVAQLLPMIDTPELRAQRMANWSKELQDPKTAGVASLRLEGLGVSAAESLQAGLKSNNAQVRFFAAESLAYLDDVAGVEVLGETAIAQKEFRAYALAALAATQQSAAQIKLRKLMDEPNIEVRYGAFNALRTLDPHNPSLGQVRILDDPNPAKDGEEESPDAMAIALASASRRAARAEDPFALYVVDSDGPPVVHISRTRRSEIVVFGRSQQLMPPVVLGSGAILLNAAEKDDKLEMSKIVPSKFGDSDAKVRTSLDLGEVIRQAANLGATYPEIVTILEAADRQKNLPGLLVVDAVPISNTDYIQSAILGKDKSAKSDPALERASAQPSRFRRLLSFRNRDQAASPAKSPEKAASTSQGASKTSSPGDAKASTAGIAPPPAPEATAKTVDTASDPVKTDSTPSTGTPAKKDDALQKAGAEAPTSRIRLFDRLRRRQAD